MIPALRRHATALGCGLALLVVACSPAEPPAVTAPPLANDAPMWPDVTWGSQHVVEAPPGMRDERVEAVATAGDVFVAVGVATGDGRDVGQVWWAGRDGVMTRGSGPFDGVALLDVEAGPGGFVAVGTRSGDPWLGGVTRLALFRSVDGRTWQAVLDGARAPQGYATGIAAGPAGYLVIGSTDPELGAIGLTSPDGTTWTETHPTVDGRAGGVGDPVADAGGWLAPMGGTASPAIARSTDGMTWTTTAVEPSDTDGQYLSRVVHGPGGYLASGAAGPDCGPGASCAAETVTWWSGDGVTWGRQTGIDPVVGLSSWATHPERGYVTVDGSRAMSSPDGWRWSPLGEIANGQIGVRSVVVVGDRIVAGGEQWMPDGTSRAAFIVGGPHVELLQ